MKFAIKKEIRVRIKELGLLVYKAGDNLVNHDGVEHAGYLSFVMLLALLPFLIFFVAILGALGQTEAGDEFIHMLLSTAPKYLTEAMMPRINEILSGPPQGLLTLSILGTIWTSSSIVEGMRTVLNRAYHVKTPRNYYFRRAVSIGQIFLLTLILIISMLGLVIIPPIFEKIYGMVFTYQAITNGSTQHIDKFASFNFFTIQWQLVRYSGVVLVLFFFISILYYVLPNVKHKWKDTLPGAVVAVIGWLLLGKGMTYYLINYNRVNLIYGSLTNIIVFMLFFYILMMIFIYGAEFNYLLEKYLGHKIVQKEVVSPEHTKPSEQNNQVVKPEEIVIPHDKPRE